MLTEDRWGNCHRAVEVRHTGFFLAFVHQYFAQVVFSQPVRAGDLQGVRPQSGVVAPVADLTMGVVGSKARRIAAQTRAIQ